ncbi:MAG: hypothetical protein GXZ15_03710, partial [Campylobacter sp.]|nr:hypothetical protein [Campylobacter sp.]
MNKAYKHIYKEGVGWIAISEEASGVSSSRGSSVVKSSSKLSVLGAILSKSKLLKEKLSLATVVALVAGGLSFGALSPAHAYYAGGSSSNTAKGNVAIGGGGIVSINDPYYGATASGGDSVAIGSGVIAKAPNNVGGAVAIGNGTTQAIGAQAVAIGSDAEATASQSMAIGNDTSAKQLGSIAIGGDDTLDSNFNNTGISYGLYLDSLNRGAYVSGEEKGYRRTTSDGLGAIAVGVHAQALSQGATAIGLGSTVGKSSDDATAIGTFAYANGFRSTAIGFNAQALAKSGTAIGDEAIVNAEDSLAIGNSSKVNTGVSGGIALGSNSVADRVAGIAGYVPSDAFAEQEAAILATTSKSGAVSVGGGTAGNRQIVNVAAGTNDNDAVNVAQLKASRSEVEAGTNVVSVEKEVGTDNQ